MAWPFSVRTSPSSKSSTVHGLAFDKGLLDRGEIVLGRVGEHRATLAERFFGLGNVAHFADLIADLTIALSSNRAATLRPFNSPYVLVSVRISNSSSWVQGAQAHVGDGVGLELPELERLDQRRLRLALGRMILITLSMFKYAIRRKTPRISELVLDLGLGG